MSLPRPLLWGYFALAAWMAVAVGRSVAAVGEGGVVFEQYGHVTVLAGASLLCGARVVLRREERLVWGAFTAAILSWTLGELYFVSHFWSADEVPFVSAADIGYLAAPIFMLIGIVSLARSRASDPPLGLRADGVAAGLAVGALNAATILDPILDAASGNAAQVAVVLSYPVTDLILIGCIVGALAGTGWQLDRVWLVLAAGVTAFGVADSIYYFRLLNGDFVAGTIEDLPWVAGLTLISAAAWVRPSYAGRNADGVAYLRRVRRMSVMPIFFALLNLSVLVYAALVPVSPVAVGLAAAGLVAVVVRLTLALLHNDALLKTREGEALTDPLTGLPNRRALVGAIERLVESRGQAADAVLVFFDLNGFKLYNDTFGHAAGDGLLIRVGQRLGDHMDGIGTAYRLGGDEFCALFSPRGLDVASVVEGASAALEEHGDGFSISNAYGSIVLPREAATASEAMRIADQRMYADKDGSRASARRQSADVLLSVLGERSPALSTHLRDVAEMAGALATDLGLPDAEVQRIQQAAELHDVGMVAIPDGILGKPGGLTGRERAFVQQHTLIGERIVAAAPALEGLAKMVRATHERWDGAGYPDGARGEAIPVGARVIAVVDAFHTITEGRPYDAPRTVGQALAELRACAGTQFDPAIVERFCRRHEESPPS